MQVSGLTDNRIQITMDQSVDSQNSVSKMEIPSDRESLSLSIGQIISGKVLESQDGQILLSVNDLQLSARILEDILLAKGQEYPFLVKGDQAGQMLLAPLMANTSQIQNGIQALQMAQLPITAENQYMVGLMMQEGLSISKDALQSMAFHMQEVGLENLPQAIGLTRMGLDITLENCVQYGNYEKMTHAIGQGMTDIMSSIPNAYDSLVQSGQIDQAIVFEKEVISLFLAAGTQDTGKDEKVDGGQDIQIIQNGNRREDVMQDRSTVPDAIEQSISDSNGLEKDNMEEARYKPVSSLLNEQEVKQFIHKLERAGIGLKEAVTGMDVHRVLSSIQDSLQNVEEFSEEHKKALVDLLGSKSFHKIFAEQMERQWMADPEQVASEDGIKNLYHRLFDTTDKLQKVMESIRNAGIADRGVNNVDPLQNLSTQVTDMRNNLDFMNQINQLQTYVQLPVRLNGNNGNGDLYVYTNKKSLANKDGNVTALLHLDMDHLGPLDVYIAMQQNHVRTKFYLQEESMIDFLAEHMHILDEHLAARGYAMHAEVLSKKEMKADGIEQGIMDTILCKKSIPQWGASNMQGFDVKA